MKRKLFYLFERLQIKRSERIAVTSLLMLSMLLTAMYSFSDILFPNEEYDYSRSDSLFAVKSAQAQKERSEIMMRYKPLPDLPEESVESGLETASLDTVNPDSSKKGTNDDVNTLVNINTATAEKLQELPGIGPVYSARIVEWREENGKFTSKEQLIEIKGIGEKRLATIKPLIRL